MSKLFNMESQHQQPGPDELKRIQQEARKEEAFDAEAALHVELLTQTDAKLDRINARLERFTGELNQWGRRVEEAEHRIRERQVVVPHRRRSPLAFFVLLVLGAAAGALYTTWQDQMYVVKEMSGTEPAASLSANKTEPPVQEADAEKPAPQPKLTQAPPLLELPQLEQPAQVKPEPVEAAADQPPAPAPVQTAPAPEVVAQEVAQEPQQAEIKPQGQDFVIQPSVPAPTPAVPTTPVAAASEPSPAPTAVMPQAQQEAPQAAVQVSRDAEIVQPVMTSSGHGRIQM